MDKFMKKTKSAAVLMMVIFLLLFNCATTGPGGKTSLILISTSDEVSIGQSMSKEVESQNKVIADPVVENYINGLGQKLAGVSDRTDLQYHFKVLDSKDINAFACPGGFIYVYSGLLKTIDNEAQLASVMAHEIGHVVARHSVKRLQQVLGIQVLLSIALGQSSEIIQQAVSTGVGVILQGYSRDNEYEADYDGALYMTNAGYNPQGMIQLFQKLVEMEKGGNTTALDKLFESHPPTTDRITRVQEEIQSFNLGAKPLVYGQEEYQKIKARLK
jgi:beta-barrel assembly-enhancing protease